MKLDKLLQTCSCHSVPIKIIFDKQESVQLLRQIKSYLLSLKSLNCWIYLYIYIAWCTQRKGYYYLILKLTLNAVPTTNVVHSRVILYLRRLSFLHLFILSPDLQILTHRTWLMGHSTIYGPLTSFQDKMNVYTVYLIIHIRKRKRIMLGIKNIQHNKWNH